MKHRFKIGEVRNQKEIVELGPICGEIKYYKVRCPTCSAMYLVTEPTLVIPEKSVSTCRKCKVKDFNQGKVTQYAQLFRVSEIRSVERKIGKRSRTKRWDV